MNRRRFIYRSSGFLAGSLLLDFVPVKLFANLNKPDLVKVKSSDYYRATFRAVEELGGMNNLVKTGDKVGLLINSAFDIKGAYVNPDIPLAVMFMCWEAGASEIIMLQPVAREYWKRSELFSKHRFIIDELKEVSTNVFPAVYNDDDFFMMPSVTGAKVLKDIEIIKSISEVDVFINIPILKHHASTVLTGALKNMMGLTTRKTNVNFHLGSGKRNDPEYLAQSIADLNLVRKPDLVVADATEFITGNGPDGPGPMKKLDLVVAGKDPVAVDAFGAFCLDYSAEDVLTVAMASELGIGEMDLSKLTIAECEI